MFFSKFCGLANLNKSIHMFHILSKLIRLNIL